MNRSVLIITPYFAPQSHAAVFRAYKLAKLLPRFGWKPYVLTVDRNYLYNEDRSLLDALPDEVEITTARHVEPTVRGLRMALGGRDRSFAALKARGPQAGESADPARPVAAGWMSGLYRHIRDSWINVPDPYWSWRGPAVRAGRALIHAHRIPIVYSTCMPFTAHEIGRTLRREGCRWVADFRDPATYAARMCSAVDRVYMIQRRIERDALREADAVTVLSSAYAMIFRDLHGELDRRPIHFIPTGLDEDLLDVEGPQPRTSGPFIVFAGEFLPEYGGMFLEAFAAALERAEVRQSGIKLLVVGQIGLNRSRLAPWLDRLGLSPHVEFRDHMPQAELYRLLRAARAGVLAPGREAHWWNNFAKMVDYIALRKPVLAVVPDPSEARTCLTRAGLGLFLDGDARANGDHLSRFLLGNLAGVRPDEDECDRYLATEQVRAFAGLFESLLSPSEENGPGPREARRDERAISMVEATARVPVEVR
ncbi:MAG: hypothetical protein JWN86_3630 [Planctomycetota bacterium]|nr:hypothetical protein [Planctomycetota bacterium]